MSEIKKTYDILDLTKFILTLMIVAIHTQLFPKVLYPWLLLAVPIFFIISSYLLFDKINKSPTNRKIIIKNYVIRLLKMYIFWFIILLPYIILLRKNWFDDGIFIGIIRTIKNILFSSTFPASWYIVSLIEGVLLVQYLSTRIKQSKLFVIFLIINIICCFTSSYCCFFDKNIVIDILNFIEPQFTFLVSLIYILIGKMFAENKFYKINKKWFMVLNIISVILLFLEWKVIYYYTGRYDNACYVFIVPLVFSIFAIIKNIDINLKHSKKLRQVSSFIYPIHIVIISFVKFILIKLNISNGNMISVISFLGTIFICIILYLIIKKLEKIEKLKFLKYSY